MISVIIPVYNERATIMEIVHRVLAEPTEKEVIIVDDGSTDGTWELLQSCPEVRVVRQAVNQGKGAAIQAGLAEVQGEITLIQDADLELDPNDYRNLLAPITAGSADVVYGARFLRPENWEGYRLISWIGNTVVTGFTNLLFNSRLTDEATGYKVMRTSLLRSLNLQCAGFDFCAEVTAKLLKRGIVIIEVPVRFNPRTYVEGKKIGWRDGIIALYTLFKFRWR